MLNTSKKFEYIALCAIIIIGVAIRFHGLGEKGLWNDEILIARAVREPTVKGMLYDVWEMFGSTPVLPLIERILPQGPHPEFWARFPSAVSGTIAVWVIFLLGRRLSGPAAGLGAALLLAVNPLHVYFSQHARFYSLLTTLAMVQLITLMRATEIPAGRRWVVFFALTSLCFYSGYYTLFLLLGEALALLFASYMLPWRKSFRSFGGPFLLAITGAFIAFLPWFIRHSSRNIFAMFGPPPGFLRPVIATVQEFGPIDPMTYPLIYKAQGLPDIGPLLFLLLATIGMARAVLRRDLKGWLLVVPLLITIPSIVAFETWITSFFYRPKQVIFILPLYLIAISSAIFLLCGYFRRLRRPATLAVFMALTFLSGLAVQSYARREEHQGFRPAARYLMEHRRDGEPVGIHQAYYEPVFRFYYRAGAIPLDSMEKARSIAERGGWFVTVMEHTDDPEVGEYIYRSQEQVAAWQPDPEYPEIRIYRGRGGKK